MKKLFFVLGDVAVTVGCCVGVGMLSGKESQIFYGNGRSIVFFAAAFFVINIALRNFCRAYSCDSLSKISKACFGKFSAAVNVALLACCFACAVTVTAGAEQCLSSLIYVGSFPLYSLLCAAISAIILAKGMQSLKTANAVSIVLALAFVALLLSKKGVSDTADTSVGMSAAYAVFSVTMSLSVISKSASQATPTQNAVSSALSAILLGAIMFAVTRCCNYSYGLPALTALTSPAEKGFAVITLLLATVTGTVANVYPIYETLSDVIPDKTLRSFVIFAAALAFSAFGFDFAVKFGYGLVSVVGTVILTVGTVKYFRKAISTKKPRKD